MQLHLNTEDLQIKVILSLVFFVSVSFLENKSLICNFRYFPQNYLAFSPHPMCNFLIRCFLMILNFSTCFFYQILLFVQFHHKYSRFCKVKDIYFGYVLLSFVSTNIFSVFIHFPTIDSPSPAKVFFLFNVFSFSFFFFFLSLKDKVSKFLFGKISSITTLEVIDV